MLLPDRQTPRASMTYPRQSSTCCCCIPALLLLALLQLSAPSPSGAAIVGVTTDMEMDFSDLLLETMRASAAAAAAAKLRFSFAANTNNAWVPWPVNNASAPSQMEILMEFVHEIILMDYGSDCHDPSTGVPGMLCNPNDFLNRAWPWITHAALVNRRNAPGGRTVLITMATEPGPAGRPWGLGQHPGAHGAGAGVIPQPVRGVARVEQRAAGVLECQTTCVVSDGGVLQLLQQLQWLLPIPPLRNLRAHKLAQHHGRVSMPRRRASVPVQAASLNVAV